MGCDIHTYLEYRAPGSNHWRGHGGQFNPGRDYRMFGFIAGLRGPDEPVIELKGLPDGLSWQAEGDAHVRVSDEHGEMNDGYCTVTQAHSWGNPDATEGDKIHYPDWHSHTWLTCDEFKLVLGHYTAEYGLTYAIEWRALLASMMEYAEADYDTRLVIWFDN